MANVDYRLEQFQQFRWFLENAQNEAPLQHGGGGGTSDGGMETRIAVLEADVAHIKIDMGDVKADVRGLQTSVGELRVSVGRLEERVTHLPTKEYLVKVVLGALAVVAALVTFSDKLHALVH